MAEKSAVFALTPKGGVLARRIALIVDGKVIGKTGRMAEADRLVDDIAAVIRASFKAGQPVIAVMASGALIRILAPLLADKHAEPPVIAVSEDGRSVVPLLGGHHGANALARDIAGALDGHAAVTTAGDLRFGVALDEPPQGYSLADPENAKAAMASLLAGESAKLEGEAEWLKASGIAFADDGKVSIRITDKTISESAGSLTYHPRTLVLGMGCERGADADELIELAGKALADGGLAAASLAAIASINVKADEAAIHAVAAHFAVPAIFFEASRLEQETPRLANPSDIVFAEVGCHGVAEGAALAAAGKRSKLIQAKIKSKRATAAIARAESIRMMEDMKAEGGRSQGRLFVVGIGPGQEAWRSPEVSRMIGEATDLVGYSLYLDLIADISPGKTRHDFDLGKEEDRVRHAMELAGGGRDVALVCSGDAGIYAMATLVFELLKDGGLSDAAQRIAIAVSPGISALQAAAARAGAPLGHDFCTISLSDLLTPWEAIKMRVKAAAEGDFVIAFYNPVSKRRRTQLAHAKDVLLQHRPADTPVILATDLGRPGEKVRIVPLSALEVDDVDMLTVVVVGSSETQTVQTGDGKTWVYTPRGYSAKAGTGIGAGQ